MNGANSAVDPDTSQRTIRSGLVGRLRRRTGLTGTPPVLMEDRIVRRMSSPDSPRRRRLPRRVANRRARGRIACRKFFAGNKPAGHKKIGQGCNPFLVVAEVCVIRQHLARVAAGVD